MPTLTELTTGVQTVTATGAVTPTAGVDISGMSGDVTLCIEIVAMTAGQNALIQIEDSVNAFTASIARKIENVEGGAGSPPFTAGAYTPSTERRSVRKYQLPSNRFGTSSAAMRANVTVISGGTLSFHAWLET